MVGDESELINRCATSSAVTVAGCPVGETGASDGIGMASGACSAGGLLSETFPSEAGSTSLLLSSSWGTGAAKGLDAETGKAVLKASNPSVLSDEKLVFATIAE